MCVGKCSPPQWLCSGQFGCLVVLVVSVRLYGDSRHDIMFNSFK